MHLSRVSPSYSHFSREDLQTGLKKEEKETFKNSTRLKNNLPDPTALKLQKLVYYAQGFHLAIYDKPLFDEPIVKWEHGPVIESLYHEYKKYSSNAIPVPGAVDTSIFSDEQKELLNEVFEVYGQFSAWKLRCMTHEEPPWKQAQINSVIDLELMKKYFKTQLSNG